VECKWVRWRTLAACRVEIRLDVLRELTERHIDTNVDAARWKRAPQGRKQLLADRCLMETMFDRLRVAGFVLAATIASAQPPTFTAASVKPSKPDDRGIAMQFLPGRLVARNLPLHIIVAMAYNVPFQGSRLIGGPEWIRTEHYDIEATADTGTLKGVARINRMRAMLQTLLADRFKLVVRRDPRELPVYAIVVAKDGPKLEKAKVQEAGCPDTRAADGFECHQFSGGQGRGLHGQAVDMADLANYVENWAERPVIDKTGLKGLYRIDTKPWLSMRPGPAPPSGAKGEDGSDLADLPTLFDVFTRLGLKLDAQKARVEVVEITGIERATGN
jgi:uncharacterized protein (TIGR03435 family)